MEYSQVVCWNMALDIAVCLPIRNDRMILLQAMVLLSAIIFFANVFAMIMSTHLETGGYPRPRAQLDSSI